MTVIGLDIGGANLKASDGLKRTISVSFPLWQRREQLAAAVADLLLNFPANAPIVVTMTGELADCYATRAVGVQSILEAVQDAAGFREVLVWQTTGEFLTPDEAIEFPVLTAASNWHALATWGGRMAPGGTSLLLDIGSTTTDIIPIEDGVPMPEGRTDLERLRSGELVYLGVRRSPLCSVLSEIDLGEGPVPLAREVFATTMDAHLWLNLIPEQSQNCETANGRPATRVEAAQRLARAVCSDLDDIGDDEIQAIASACYQREIDLVCEGLGKVLSRHPVVESILITGEGEFLGQVALEQHFGKDRIPPVISLSASLHAEHSAGACAYSLSRLAQELFHEEQNSLGTESP
ncbi:hydantoinase/oxoprolinase family protein [Planctomicrobium sp. SH668]|uniref:hydantoinase/oxoprolinase family protein n=1 Tax=Planctomicrobium sp. SH668 TaxID=3448126 RepID=UPI003F5CAB7B